MIKTVHILLVVCLMFLALSCGSESKEATQIDPTTPRTEAATAAPKIKPEPPLLKQPSVDGKSTVSIVNFTALDTKGQSHNSSEWIGHQPVVINVWGTWCPPCRREIPELVRLYDEYREKGVEMLGLAVRDNPATVEGFAAKNKMSWVMLMGEQRQMITLGSIRSVPTTIFLDKTGRELKRFVGPRDYETFKGAFESIL